MTIRRAYHLQVTPVDPGWFRWGSLMEVQVRLDGQLLRTARVWGRTKPHALRAAIRWGRHLARRHHGLHGFGHSVTYSPPPR